MSTAIPVTLIPGDGIGPEIVEATVKVLEAAGAAIEWDRQFAGMAALNAVGDPMPVATLESIERTRRGAQGPARDANRERLPQRERRAAHALRSLRERPPGAHAASRTGRYSNVDIILVRENTEGLYSGVEHYVKIGNDDHAAAESVAIITRAGAERVIRFAFEHAVARGRKKLTLVHKANILKLSQGLFLDTGRKIAKEYEGRIMFEERIIDAMAMHLVLEPRALRRDRDDEHVRRHSLRRDLRARGRAGPGAGREHRREGVDLRGGARHGAGHRGEGRSPTRARWCSRHA